MGYQSGNVDDNEVKKDIREVVELAFQVRGYDVKDENVQKQVDDYVDKIFENLRVTTLRGRLQNKYLKMR